MSQSMVIETFVGYSSLTDICGLLGSERYLSRMFWLWIPSRLLSWLQSSVAGNWGMNISLGVRRTPEMQAKGMECRSSKGMLWKTLNKKMEY